MNQIIIKIEIKGRNWLVKWLRKVLGIEELENEVRRLRDETKKGIILIRKEKAK